jgi:hypothetical protein
MSTIEGRIEIAAPIEETFRHLSWFETFPEFDKSVEQVRRDPADPTVLHGTLTLGSLMRESIARTEVDAAAHRVSWHSESGLRHSGEITLWPRSQTSTLLRLRMQFRPAGFAEHVGDRAGLVSRRVRLELRRFAIYVESHRTRCPAHRRVLESGLDDRIHAPSVWITDHMFGKPDDTTWVRKHARQEAKADGRAPASPRAKHAPWSTWTR